MGKRIGDSASGRFWPKDGDGKPRAGIAEAEGTCPAVDRVAGIRVSRVNPILGERPLLAVSGP